MSQFYEMSVEISGYDPAKAKEIQAAAEAEWPLEDWWSATDQPGEMMHASAQSSLCGGEERLRRTLVPSDMAGQWQLLQR